MCKRLLLVISVVLVNFGTPIAAQTVWNKYVGNPVLDLGPPGAWDDTRVVPGQVILEGGIYRLWYTGWDGTSNPDDKNFQIGYATSPDGINWTREATNPVLGAGSSGTWESWSAANPAIIKDGDVYKMWYSGSNSTIRAVGYAWSYDGIHWEKYEGNPVLQQGSAGQWDSWSAFWCSVVKDGSVYKMWYSGGTSFTYQQIGYATSSDGMNWDKYEVNPILSPGQCSSGLRRAWFPHVLKDGTMFHMWFRANDESTGRIGYASSQDGVSWGTYCYPWVLDVGEPGDWDDGGVGMGCVLKTGDVWRMWYVGQEETGESEVMRMGYASFPDCNGNATPDSDELDSDADGVIDDCDICPNDADNDVDSDGVCGDEDGCPNDPGKTEPGVCGCGIADTDTDGDGVADCIDACSGTPKGIPVNTVGCPSSCAPASMMTIAFTFIGLMLMRRRR